MENNTRSLATAVSMVYYGGRLMNEWPEHVHNRHHHRHQHEHSTHHNNRTIEHMKTAEAMIMFKMDSDNILVETHLIPLLAIEHSTMATIGTDVS